MLTNSSPSTSSQEEQMDFDDAINEEQQLLQEQTKQFLLPIELHCEVGGLFIKPIFCLF
jgi:hypothetical protein